MDTELTTKILAAGATLDMPENLRAYFSTHLDGTRMAIPERKSHGQTLRQSDVEKLFDHVTVIRTVGMALGAADQVRSAIMDAFRSVNTGQKIHNDCAAPEYSMCGCSVAERFAHCAHECGFEEDARHILASTRCYAAVSTKAWWEAHPKTPTEQEEWFWKYAVSDAQNALQRLLQ